MTSEPIDEKKALAFPGGSILARTGLPSATLSICIVIVLTFVNVFTGSHLAAFLAIPFLISYFVSCWSMMIVNGRVMLAACGLVALLAAIQPGGAAILAAGASRMIFLPSFVALLGLLRAAASASEMIAVAGRHLVNQPPPRRYMALSFGGHFFGVLLNVGGLALLVEMLREANTLEAAGGSHEIVAWRERRMVAAVLRGFAAMPFWSPLGVSFNLLLVSVPGVTWWQCGPTGMLCATGFICLGWAFDQFQRPKGLKARPLVNVPGGALAVAAIVGHVAAVTALTWLAEFALRLPFQTALLVSVPAYAFAWTAAIRRERADPAPVRSAAQIMLRKGVGAFPAYVNEIAVFAASGFLGAALVALVPRESLQAFFLSFTIPPGVFAALLCVSVAFLGFIGLNPMISATLIASAVASADLPGLSKAAIVLSIAAGWACTVVGSSMNSALLMAAAIAGRTPWTVAIRWNGLFAITALFLSVVILIIAV